MVFQKIGACYELLEAVRLLCVSLWPDKVQHISDLRLEMIIRMLKTPHFSARMNALKVRIMCKYINIDCHMCRILRNLLYIWTL